MTAKKKRILNKDLDEIVFKLRTIPLGSGISHPAEKVLRELSQRYPSPRLQNSIIRRMNESSTTVELEDLITLVGRVPCGDWSNLYNSVARIGLEHSSIGIRDSTIDMLESLFDRTPFSTQAEIIKVLLDQEEKEQVDWLKKDIYKLVHDLSSSLIIDLAGSVSFD